MSIARALFNGFVIGQAFQPSIEAIKNKYYELYRGKGGAGEGDEGDEGAADGDAEVREGEAGPSSAGQK